MEKLVYSFTATAMDGAEYEIGVYRKKIDASTLRDGASSTLGKVATLRTSDGRHVNPRDDGSLEIIGGIETIIVVPDDDISQILS